MPKVVDEAPSVAGSTAAEEQTQLTMLVAQYFPPAPFRRCELYCDKVLVAKLLTENISLLYAFPCAKAFYI